MSNPRRHLLSVCVFVMVATPALCVLLAHCHGGNRLAACGCGLLLSVTVAFWLLAGDQQWRKACCNMDKAAEAASQSTLIASAEARDDGACANFYRTAPNAPGRWEARNKNGEWWIALVREVKGSHYPLEATIPGISHHGRWDPVAWFAMNGWDTWRRI